MSSFVSPMNVIAFLLLALATPVFGQLKWENPEQTFTAKPLDKVVAAKFRFTNVGTTSVKITDLHPSCGCTTAYLEKKEYAPGESGEIEASFSLTDASATRRSGLSSPRTGFRLSRQFCVSRSTFPKRLRSSRSSFCGALAIS